MTKAVEIKPDFAQVRKWLESVINDPDTRRRVLIRASLELTDRARAYPPAGPWNSAPGINGRGWYQRQFGPRWLRRDGTTGGRNTSERLQKNWRTEISNDVYSASVYTPVSYAPFLYDPAQRASWAAAHGWATIDQIANDYTPRFLELVGDEIDKQIAKPIK